jgi:single-stranded-DNA-specific exonuclease
VVIAPRLNWILPEPIHPPPTLAGFGPATATLLARRGLTTDAQVAAFVSGGPTDLHQVLLMTDAQAALDRLEQAVDRGEQMAVWGDYDADGMTAAAIWILALRALGADLRRYLPSREREGYGLSLSGIRTLADEGVRLIITCDCGVGNVAEVAEATSLGVDVIVTDHHVAPATLPTAVAVVDPHRPGDAYPDKDLTGAGVAWKLASALLGRRGSGAADLVALAAIGTLADMAPLTGESRIIVRLGLAELAETRRPGLRLLLERSADDSAAPTARDLAFGLAPRLNAAGRIADASLALDLLLTEDPVEAARLDAELELLHRQRQTRTAELMVEARALADLTPGTTPLAVRSDGWSAGLVGLIAGRLADQMARPVAAATTVGEEIRGSVRAPSDFHVADALTAVGEHLSQFGGHAGAGGFSLAEVHWEAFRDAFAALPRPFPAGDRPVLDQPDLLAVDLVLPGSLVGWELLAEFERLAPFGPGNPEPVLAIHGLRVGTARRMGTTDAHVAFRLLRGAETVDAVGFGVGGDVPLPGEGELIDVVATLERDTFRGLPRLRLRLLDWASPAESAIAGRRQPVAVHG